MFSLARPREGWFPEKKKAVPEEGGMDVEWAKQILNKEFKVKS